MKKIILLAIMLGLVGCGENGSSDVTSPTNNQSTELTSNNIQQASARSISTYSMTVPFDGWHLFNPKALGASALYEGAKNLSVSTTALTADASQVAKVLGKGVAGYALSIAVEQLLGAVDWVLDPANNQIKYKIPASDPNDPTVQTIYTIDTARKNIYAVTMDQACSKAVGVYFNSSITSAYYNQSTKTCWVRGLYFGNEYVADSGKFLFTLKNPLYDPNAKPEEKKLPLETVAQKVIENADAGSLDAQVATMAAAAQILEDAANDQALQQPIVDDLNRNAHNKDRPECKTIITVLYGNVQSLSTIFHEMLLDKHDLYYKYRTEPHPTYGSWEQLGNKYAAKQHELSGNIMVAEQLECPVPLSAQIWSETPAPDKPAVATSGMPETLSKQKAVILRR
ncbi:hypothetical protein [Acinetobacter tandoii]